MEKTTNVRKANRRRSERRRTRGYVRVECRKGAHGMGANLTSAVLDLSDSGTRLVLLEEIELNGEVEIIIGGYGTARPLRRIANVRWLYKLDDGRFCAGIEFQKLLPYRDWVNLAAPQ